MYCMFAPIKTEISGFDLRAFDGGNGTEMTSSQQLGVSRPELLTLVY